MPSPPELTRLVLVADGCVKANFSDGSILVLSSSGHAFVCTQADGQRQRQLSEFALHRHAAALAVVLEFRNMHAEQPCHCDRLARVNPREGLRLGFRMSELWWPATAEEAMSQGLMQQSEDGKVALSTEDSAGRIVLHQHRRRFAICYPLLTHEHLQEGSYEYVWQTQVFSLQSYPPRWGPAVTLVLQAAEHMSPPPPPQQHGQQQHQSQDTQQDIHVVDQGGGCTSLSLPTPAHHKHHSSTSTSINVTPPGAAHRTELPSALRLSVGAGAQDRCPSDGWWSEQTLSLLPDTDLVLLEWTPEASYQFHPDAREVEVWVHHDESCLATSKQGRFVSHFKPSGATQDHPGQVQVTEQLFLAECVPESAWSGKGQAGRYALASLAAHAAKLRHQMSGVAAGLSAAASHATGAGPAPCCAVTGRPLWSNARSKPSQPAARLGLLSSQIDETFAVVSEEVLEESHVPGSGVFTAYADGRLRANFEDRTILHMNAARSHCKVVLPDGELVLVAASQPVGVEVYVDSALHFLDWALRPACVRQEEAEAQAHVQAELNSLQRLNAIHEWTANSKAQRSSFHTPVPQPVPQLTHCQDLALHLPTQPSAMQHVPAGAFSPGDVEAMLRRNAELLNRL